MCGTHIPPVLTLDTRTRHPPTMLCISEDNYTVLYQYSSPLMHDQDNKLLCMVFHAENNYTFIILVECATLWSKREFMWNSSIYKTVIRM